MIRSNNLNWYEHGGYTEVTAPFLNINVTNKGKSKRSIANENLSQSCSTNKNKPKRIIFNKPLSQKYYTDKNELGSTKEDES